jgi:hypothetical protein
MVAVGSAVFNAASNAFVFLNSLTLTNGYSTNSDGGIYNGGTLTLTNCILSGHKVFFIPSPCFSGSFAIQQLLQNKVYLWPRNFALVGGEHIGSCTENEL